MKLLMKVSLLVVAFGVAWASLPALQAKSSDLSLMKFMMEHQTLANQNPGRSAECFATYIPVLNNITLQYQENYESCIAHANQTRTYIDERAGYLLQPIIIQSREACSNIMSCDSLTINNTMALECYAATGSANSQVMYKISANATNILTETQEAYMLAESQESKCLYAAKLSYESETTETYELLQKCINGEL